jgi:hypothetical protein
LRSRSHGVGGSEIGLRNLFQFADDVVTVRGAYDAMFSLHEKNETRHEGKPDFPGGQGLAGNPNSLQRCPVRARRCF